MSTTMASHFNATVPVSDAWSGYLAHAQDHLKHNSRLALILLINAPLIAIVFNVLRQLVFPRKPTEPPTVFHWFPVIGSAISYGTNPIDFLSECQKKHGDVFTFILFGRRVTVALGPKGNNFILGGKSTVFNAEDAYTHLTTPVFGKGVVYDVPNEIFMQQKKFIKVGLSTENFKAYVGMFEEEVEDFIKHDHAFSVYQRGNVDEWGSFDAMTVAGEIIILTAARTLQGKEVRGGMDKTFADVYADLDGGFTPLNFLFPNLPLESYRKRDRAHQKLSQFYVDIIKKRRTAKDDHEPDMIAALMQQTYRDGRPLNNAEMAHIMIALLMAGQHTSSTTSSWILLHLAANPDVADALYQEQVNHFRGPDGKLRQMTYEDVRSLPLLDSVIRETLRMHPPIHSIMRYVRDDVPVPSTLSSPSEDGIYIVPKGNYVLASPAVSQVDRTVWKNADTWDPYRWNDSEGVAAQAYKADIDENGEKIDYGYGVVSKGTDSPYQPFGAGRHRCIGEQFAYLQLGTVIAVLIREMEFRIDRVPDHDYTTMITTPKRPREIRYRKRQLA